MSGTPTIWHTDQRNQLIRIATSVLGSHTLAEEIVQDAYLKLLEQDLNSIVNTSAWLTQVTRNLAIDRARRMGRERKLLLLLPGLELPSSPDIQHLMERQLSGLILRVLNSSNPYITSLVLLHTVFGLSYDHLAQITGLTPASCRQRVSRALRKCFSLQDATDFNDDVADIYVHAILEGSTAPLLQQLNIETPSCKRALAAILASGVGLPPSTKTGRTRQVLALTPTGVKWVLMLDGIVLSVLGFSDSGVNTASGSLQLT